MILIDTMFNRINRTTLPQGVLFDLDDTLYPERQYVHSGFEAVAAFIYRIYGKRIYDDLTTCYDSGERSNVFGTVLNRYFDVVEDSLLRQIVSIFWSHRPRIDLYEDARIGMALLFTKGIKVGVITTGQSAIQRAKIEALALKPLLDGLIYTDELIGEPEPGRPCEDAFHIAALMMDVELCDLCYVGDNPYTDFVVPRRMGIPSIRVRRDGTEHASKEPPSIGFQPDAEIDSLEKITLCFQQRATR
ncbi:MAG: HAD family hydrolase [Spartobacteria bacterium]|nr:HAD family hydrolase [Spartobacteria bacterium]